MKDQNIGIGLHSAREIAQTMGGSVRLVQSDCNKPDLPTIFQVDLNVTCSF